MVQGLSSRGFAVQGLDETASSDSSFGGLRLNVHPKGPST